MQRQIITNLLGFTYYQIMEQQNSFFNLSGASSEKTVFSGLGLSTNFVTKISSDKSVLLKEINPTYIYEWLAQSESTDKDVPAEFRVKDINTNEVVFWCFAKKWKGKIPHGKAQIGHVLNFKAHNPQDKIKQKHIFTGKIKQLKKHGDGTYSVETFYNNGKSQIQNISGRWENDVFLQGKIQNDQGTKSIAMKKNIQWSRVKSRRELITPNSNLMITSSNSFKIQQEVKKSPIKFTLSVPK